MTSAPLTAWLDFYRRSFKDALDAAAADGFRSLYASALRPDFNPAEFGPSARRHLQRYLSSLGTQLSGIAAEHSGGGLADPARADARVAELRQTLEFAADLGLQNVATRIGGLADDRTVSLAADVLSAAAAAADRVGVVVAVHADGPDLPRLQAEIARLNCPLLRLGLDTGGIAPADLPAALAGGAADVQLRDVRRRGALVEEVEFGAGEVDFPRLLGELAARDFRGPLVLRRDAAGAGVDALRRGKEYIEALLAGRR